jgi:hypothetical protein
MSESVERQAVATLSPEAYREFEDLVLDWLNQNEETLMLGGTGHIDQLASSVARWIYLSRQAKKYLLDEARSPEDDVEKVAEWP